MQRTYGFNSEKRPFAEAAWVLRAQWDGAVVSAVLTGSILEGPVVG